MTLTRRSDLPVMIKDLVPLSGQKLYREVFARALRESGQDVDRAERLAWEALREEYFEGANGSWERKTNL